MGRSVGIDVGSRTAKVVVLEDGEMVFFRIKENSYDPLRICRDLLKDVNCDVITATGYGRHIAREYLDCKVLSEITAFAYGARALFDSCATILDIGGQDTKAIALDESGRVRKFEMNDRCAAGTGRFLEVMAAALGYSMEDFAGAALRAGRAENVNSMCTVFAESEVISLTARGALREEVALGIHQSIVKRSVAMLKKVSVGSGLLFAGGVALNPCMRKLIEETGGESLFIPDDPQIVGALGCAIAGSLMP